MRRPWLALLLLGVATACGDGGAGGDDDVDAAPPDAGDRQGDTYVAGLEKTGRNGGVFTRLVDAVPAPPERGDNRWVLEVVDRDGGPRSDCALTVDPRMPVHQHGTPVVARVTPEGAPGRYVLEPVNLFMPGLWEVTIDLDCGGVVDEVLYAFWIEG